MKSKHGFQIRKFDCGYIFMCKYGTGNFDGRRHVLSRFLWGIWFPDDVQFHRTDFNNVFCLPLGSVGVFFKDTSRPVSLVKFSKEKLLLPLLIYNQVAIFSLQFPDTNKNFTAPDNSQKTDSISDNGTRLFKLNDLLLPRSH